MPVLANLPESWHSLPFGLHIRDDFTHYVSTDLWTTVASNSGSASVADGASGILALAPSDGTVADNDETYVRTTTELFKFAAGKPLIGRARLQFTEGSTDDANIAFGFMNAVAADSILDNGGGPKADYSGAVFFKVDGGTVWNVEKSLSTTQKTAELTAVNSLDGAVKTAGGSAYQILEIRVTPTTGNLADFDFFIDGVHVYRMKDESIESATEMHMFVGIKNGADTTVESLKVDYLEAWQRR